MDNALLILIVVLLLFLIIRVENKTSGCPCNARFLQTDYPMIDNRYRSGKGQAVKAEYDEWNQPLPRNTYQYYSTYRDY